MCRDPISLKLLWVTSVSLLKEGRKLKTVVANLPQFYDNKLDLNTYTPILYNRPSLTPYFSQPNTNIKAYFWHILSISLEET